MTNTFYTLYRDLILKVCMTEGLLQWKASSHVSSYVLIDYFLHLQLFLSKISFIHKIFFFLFVFPACEYSTMYFPWKKEIKWKALQQRFFSNSCKFFEEKYVVEVKSWILLLFLSKPDVQRANAAA